MDSNTRYVLYIILAYCIFNILQMMELKNTNDADIIIYTLLLILIISTYEIQLKEKFSELADFVDCGCTNSKFDLTKKLCSLAPIQTGNQFKESCSIEHMEDVEQLEEDIVEEDIVEEDVDEDDEEEVVEENEEYNMILGGVNYGDAKYDSNYDQRQLSVPSDYSSQPYEYGYSFLPPEKWYPYPTHPLTAKCEQPNNVMASLTSGYMTDLKDWNRAGRIMPPDDINIGFITDRLNA